MYSTFWNAYHFSELAHLQPTTIQYNLMDFLNRVLREHLNWSTTTLFVLAARTASFNLSYPIFYSRKRRSGLSQSRIQLGFNIGWTESFQMGILNYGDKFVPCLQIHWDRLLLLAQIKILNNVVPWNLKHMFYKVATFHQNDFLKLLPPSHRPGRLVLGPPSYLWIENLGIFFLLFLFCCKELVVDMYMYLLENNLFYF